MTRAIHLAHQLGADRHDWLCNRLPEGSSVDHLPADQPWRVRDGVTVLLVGNGMLRRLPRSAPSWASGVKWMHMRPTGLDEAPPWMFDVPHLTVSRGASAPAIAEYVMAAILDAEKRLHQMRVTDRAHWRQERAGGLEGRSIGLVGFGAIGRAVADRAQAFGMIVRATSRRGPPLDCGVQWLPLSQLCGASDHLVLCAPLTNETLGLFDADTLARCKPGQHLINVARGGLIVPGALRRALDGPLSRATLDVWTEEPPPEGHWLFSHPRVVLTPHCAANAASTEARMQSILEANLTAWIEGQPQNMLGRVCGQSGY